MKINFTAANVNNTVSEEVEVTVQQTKTEEMVEMTNVKTEVVVEGKGFNELRKMAKDMGIKTRRGITKVELEALITGKSVAVEVEAPIVEPATDETSVADETPVVEVQVEENKTNNSEEEVTMTNNTKEVTVNEMMEVVRKERNARAIENSALLKRTEHIIHVNEHKYVDPQHKLIIGEVNAAARRYFEAIGEYAVTVVNIEAFGARHPEARWGRVGAVVFKVEESFLQVSQWNGAIKKFEWLDVANVDFDQRTNTGKSGRFNPMPAGSGYVRLYIKENALGKYEVRLPKSHNEGKYYDIFKTADIRWGRAHSDNNANLEAALTAFIQVYAGQFIRENAKNRHGFNESCMNCRHLTYFGIKDGVNDDMEAANSTRVLQQPDIPTLANWGSRLPQAYCPVIQKYVDMEAIMAVNAAEGKDRTGMIYDVELGEERFLRNGEVEIDGKAVRVQTIREDFTKETAANCGHYHKNQHKGEHRAAADRVESGNAFLSSYWTDRAEAGRQVVQTQLADKTWVNKFPGEVAEPEAFRIKGLGGVVVYGTPEVMMAANGDFIAPVEEFDTVRAEHMAIVNKIFYAAFNLNKLTKEQADIVFAYAQNKPEGMDKRTEAAYDSAVKWLFNSLQRVLDGDAEVKGFGKHFFEGKGKDGINVKVDDFLAETRYREEHDMLGYGLGYKDLSVNPKEFVRYLDEGAAMDAVYNVLTEGVKYHVTSKSPKDKVLVAGALQELLQREVNRYVSAVRRSEDPQAELAKVGLCEEVKAYIAETVGLNK